MSFLMEIENFTYPEALRHLAKKYGIEIEEDVQEISEAEKESRNQQELLYKIHEVANNFFQEQLYDTEEGQNIGLSYFRERGLNDEILKKFQLGYSPELKNAFTKSAKEKGYDKDLLEKSGLSIFPENAPDGIDRFRERVIFPILSFSGRVLGFGARILKSNVKLPNISIHPRQRSIINPMYFTELPNPNRQYPKKITAFLWKVIWMLFHYINQVLRM